MSINHIIICGNLGKEPLYFDQYGPCAIISVATNDRWKDANGEPQETAEWHKIKVTGNLANYILENVKKGDLITVEGKIKSVKTKFLTQTGNPVYEKVIYAFKVMHHNKYKSKSLTQENKSIPQSYANKDEYYVRPKSQDENNDDDIPF